MGVVIGPKGCHVNHKDHAADCLDFMPLSGGIFHLMVELVHVQTGGAEGTFFWSVVDLECDWKTAAAAAEVELVNDASAPEHGLRLLSAAALRADLNNVYQEAKILRRCLKREYWDWAVENHSA